MRKPKVIMPTAGISCSQINAKKVILPLSHQSGQRLLLLECGAAELRTRQGHLCKWKMSLSLVPWFQRVPQAGQCVAGLDFLQGHLEGHFINLWGWSLGWNEDQRMLNEESWRHRMESICVLQDVELERWGYPSPQSLATWSHMICCFFCWPLVSF